MHHRVAVELADALEFDGGELEVAAATRTALEAGHGHTTEAAAELLVLGEQCRIDLRRELVTLGLHRGVLGVDE